MGILFCIMGSDQILLSFAASMTPALDVETTFAWFPGPLVNLWSSSGPAICWGRPCARQLERQSLFPTVLGAGSQDTHPESDGEPPSWLTRVVLLYLQGQKAPHGPFSKGTEPIARASPSTSSLPRPPPDTSVLRHMNKCIQGHRSIWSLTPATVNFFQALLILGTTRHLRQVPQNHPFLRGPPVLSNGLCHWRQAQALGMFAAPGTSFLCGGPADGAGTQMCAHSHVHSCKDCAHPHPYETEHVLLRMSGGWSVTSPRILALPLLIWKFLPHREARLPPPSLIYLIVQSHQARGTSPECQWASLGTPASRWGTE